MSLVRVFYGHEAPAVPLGYEGNLETPAAASTGDLLEGMPEEHTYEGTPTNKWSVEDIDGWAEVNGLTFEEGATKSAKLKAVKAHLTSLEAEAEVGTGADASVPTDAEHEVTEA